MVKARIIFGYAGHGKRWGVTSGNRHLTVRMGSLAVLFWSPTDNGYPEGHPRREAYNRRWASVGNPSVDNNRQSEPR